MSRCLVVLTLVLALASLTETLICPYDEQLCTCSGSTISCPNVETLPQVKPGYYDNSFSIDWHFSNGKLINVPIGSLPPGARFLSFYHQPLTNISDDAFLALGNYFFGLTISDAKFEKLPDALLKITHLFEFELINTHIETWDNSILQHLGKLIITLSLVNVSLTTWPNEFSSLQNLDLSNNLLYSVPDDALISSKNTLTYLNLKNTGITHIPMSLSILRNLVTLDLSYNNIVSGDGIQGVEKLASPPFTNTLRNMYLDSTGLTILPNLSNFTSLKNMYLSFNNISALTTNSLPSSLDKLNLRNNSFRQVPSMIATLSTLSDLDLSFNLIQEITFDAFPLNLTTLDLGYNDIVNITDPVLTRKSHLKLLHLEGNPTSTISPSAFKNLAVLEDLSLGVATNAQIPLAVTSLTRLRNLYVSTPNWSPLSCPCPRPEELVQWYDSYGGNIRMSGVCSNLASVDDYLYFDC